MAVNNNYKTISFWAIFLPDCILLYFSLYLAIAWRYGKDFSYEQGVAHYQAFSVIFVFWLLVFFIHGLFEIDSFRRYSKLAFNLTSAMLVNSLIAIIYFYLQPNFNITPRRFLLVEIILAFSFILLWHLLLKYLIKNKFIQGLYLLSFNNELGELEKIVGSHDYLGYKVLGHLNAESLAVGKFDDAAGIILPDNLHENPGVAGKLYELRTSGIKFFNYKDFYEQLLRRIYLSEVNQLWFLENINYQEKRFYNIVKRVLDLALGLLGLIAFIISFPFCSALIKLTDGQGSVLFTQERVGKKGKIFKVYKYRSMRSGTATNTWTSVNDSRITPFGKFLRKSRIDEWPQFINLIIGNMSLVGPRPEQPQIVKALSEEIPFYEERHFVKPGLTGWAQINNIYAGTSEETKLKLQYDLYYIKHRSFLFDLEIILKTIYYIFTWQGR
jgi:exopolysaccharide biosynthesis polyprenyl glycosylphosphotransferase